MTNSLITIFGYGAVGQATTQCLLARGQKVRIAQRSKPADLPVAAEFFSCDVLDAAQVDAATKGAAQIIIAVGFPYSGKVWRDVWPRAMRNWVSACENHASRLIFFDNLYMYGPQTDPLRENMPLSDLPLKPAARSAATRIWQAASQAGRIKATALRAPDFYGPGVTLSSIGDTGFGKLAQGKAAQFIGNADLPHDYAYVPDIGRALVTLLDAPDDAFGQIWHMPCAPTRSARQILEIGAKALGVAAKINNLPIWTLPALGLFVPILRELYEMRFQWDRPYRVNADKWKARFWSDVTPFEEGAKATALSFRTTS